MEFRAVLKKEFLESVREHKLIILFMGFMFFALATPPMLKLTPEIMKDTYGSEITTFFNVSALESVKNYIGKNMIQICILVMALALSGVFTSEIQSEAIVIPFVKGCRRNVMAAAKSVYYAFITFIITFMSCSLNIIYSYIVFKEDMPEINLIMLSSLKASIYVLLILSSVFLFGSMLSKGSLAGLCAMGVNILLVFLDTFDLEYNPYKMVISAANLENSIDISLFLFVFLLCILMFILAGLIFSKKKIYK